MKYTNSRFQSGHPGWWSLPPASLILGGFIYTRFMHWKTEAPFLEYFHQGPQSSAQIVLPQPALAPSPHPPKCQVGHERLYDGMRLSDGEPA